MFTQEEHTRAPMPNANPLYFVCFWESSILLSYSIASNSGIDYQY
jgi:hypothetical protein